MMDDVTLKWPFTTPWTAERIARLKEGWSMGIRSAMLAAEFGCTRNAILGKINRLGLSKPFTPAKPPKPVNTSAILRKRRERHAVRQPPRQARAEPAEPRSETNCSIYDLTDKTCRYPLGEPTHDMFYCGGASVEGLPYCGHHARICYSPARPR